MRFDAERVTREWRPPQSTDMTPARESKLIYYTLAEVKADSNKNTVDSWVSDYLLWRPVSSYVTWMLANLRITSVCTVILSIVAVGFSALVLFSNDPARLIMEAIGIEVYALPDHVDGELAPFEMNKFGLLNSCVGHFLDLYAHKILVIAMFAVGWSVASATGNDLYTVASFML